MPYQMDEIFDRLARTDIFAAIGTSGNVYPAAGFVSEARRVPIRSRSISNPHPSAPSLTMPSLARHPDRPGLG